MRQLREMKHIQSEAATLTDVMSQDVLDLLLLELASDNETTSPIDRARCTQLGKQILNGVFRWSVHTLADVGDVGEHGLLVSFSGYLRRCNHIALA